jgi:hypothetical protein
MEKFLKGCPLLFLTKGGALNGIGGHMEGNSSPGFDQDRSCFVSKVNENVGI